MAQRQNIPDPQLPWGFHMSQEHRSPGLAPQRGLGVPDSTNFGHLSACWWHGGGGWAQGFVLAQRVFEIIAPSSVPPAAVLSPPRGSFFPGSGPSPLLPQS